MPYVPSPDDATAPLESVLAGTAAAEFRAFKTKVNNLFLLSDYFSPLLQQTIRAGTILVLAPAAQVDPRIMYGHAVNITRNDIATGGGASVVAAQLSAILGNNLDGLATNISVYGIATEAWTSPTNSHATLVGGELSVISQNNANEMPLVGTDVVFKNRPDSLYAGAVVGGLGSNQYNKFSRGIQLTSQPRSTAGENCGWWRGIVFQPNSLDFAHIAGVQVPGCAIDVSAFSASPATAEPWTAYPIASALALSEYMSVTWDYLKFTRTWLDSVGTTFWIFGSGNSPVTVKRLGYDYNANLLTMPNYAGLGGAPGAASGTVPIKVNGVVRNLHFS